MGNTPSSATTEKPPPVPSKGRRARRSSFDSNAFIGRPTPLNGRDENIQTPSSSRRVQSTRVAIENVPRSSDNNPFRNPRLPAAAASSSNNLLGVPAHTGHRRSRSANAAVNRIEVNRDSAPPPYTPRPAEPQTAPITGSMASSVNANLARAGSHHTNVYSIPASSQSGARSSRNIDLEYLRAPMRRESAEDALETLRKYNTVIIVDDSRSMLGNLWLEARDALSSLADTAAQYDTDGIDVYFLNSKKVGENMRSAVAVNRLFDTVRPRGVTPIAEKLEELLLDYMVQLEAAKDRQDAGDRSAIKQIKPINYIVLTDGVPTDEPESVIIAAAKRLDEGRFPLTQVGIQFVQIGNNPRATAYLQELDDGLSAQNGVRDIVDMTPYTGGQLNAEILTKILLGGINRRVDRRGGQAVMYA